jgi:glycosyltransferase involved in cell wall biosynthesis
MWVHVFTFDKHGQRPSFNALCECWTVLKVVHVPYTFAPDPVGGTEIYVEALARDLNYQGIESLIVAPSCAGANEHYEHNGLRVRRYRVVPESKYMLRELYGEGDPEAAAAFAQILDAERPDAVHIHAFTRAVSVLVVQVIKLRRLPVFFTYHTPTVSCQRGTLMFRGKEMCDGMLSVTRCTGCSLEAQGVPLSVSALLSYVPFRLGRALEKANLSGGMWTALRMSELIQAQHQAVRALMREVDGIVALTEWVQAVLLRNGVPRSKITLSRHGLPAAWDGRGPLIDVAETPLRVAFLGRADSVKGLDTLVKAMRAAPDLRIELHLYGVSQSAADEEYWTLLKRLAVDDSRITFFPRIPNDQVVTLLRNYHVLAVPSRGFETGPLVVLESFAAGTPVIGSKLGGIAEWVRHRENGLLVDPEDIGAWADALRCCAQDRCLLSKLRQGVNLPRSMADAAHEMAHLYSRHLNFVDRRRSSSVTG